MATFKINPARFGGEFQLGTLQSYTSKIGQWLEGLHPGTVKPVGEWSAELAAQAAKNPAFEREFVERNVGEILKGMGSVEGGVPVSRDNILDVLQSVYGKEYELNFPIVEQFPIAEQNTSSLLGLRNPTVKTVASGSDIADQPIQLQLNYGRLDIGKDKYLVASHVGSPLHEKGRQLGYKGQMPADIAHAETSIRSLTQQINKLAEAQQEFTLPETHDRIQQFHKMLENLQDQVLGRRAQESGYIFDAAPVRQDETGALRYDADYFRTPVLKHRADRIEMHPSTKPGDVRYFAYKASKPEEIYSGQTPIDILVNITDLKDWHVPYMPYVYPAQQSQRALAALVREAQESGAAGVGIINPNEAKVIEQPNKYGWATYQKGPLRGTYTLTQANGRIEHYSDETLKELDNPALAERMRNAPSGKHRLYFEYETGKILDDPLANPEHLLAALPEDIRSKVKIQEHLYSPEGTKLEDLFNYPVQAHLIKFPKQESKLPVSLYGVAGAGLLGAAGLAKKTKQAEEEDIDGPDMMGAGPGALIGELLHVTVGSGGLNRLTRSVVDKVKSVLPGLERETGLWDAKGRAFRQDRNANYDIGERHFSPAHNASSRNAEMVDQYLLDMDTMGRSNIQLTPEQDAIQQSVVDGLTAIQQNRITQGGPFIHVGQQYVPPGLTPHRVWSIPKENVVETMLGGPTAKRRQLEQDYINYMQTNHGMSQSDAYDELEELIQSWLRGGVVSPISRDPSYVRREVDLGMPRSWLRPLSERLRIGNYLQATDQAAWQHFQNIDNQDSHRMARILGFAHDARGNSVPEAFWDNGDSVQQIKHPDVQSWWDNDVNRLKLSKTDPLVGMSNLVNAARIQTPAGIRDILGTLGAMPEMMKLSDYRHLPGALWRTFTQPGKIFEVGGVRRYAPLKARLTPGQSTGGGTFLSQFGLEDASGIFGRLAEAGRTLTGRNLIEAKLRQFLYEIGRPMTLSRLAQNDVKYLEKAVGPHWKNLTPDEVANRGAHSFVDAFQGSYSAHDLPKWLLPHKEGTGLWEGMFNLARWPISRYNSWVKNVVDPAREGNLKPLLKGLFGQLMSAEAINKFNELIRGSKPNELTWEEWLKLDKPEVIYTLLSKLQTAGYAGFLSQLMLAGTQASRLEQPQGYNYPLLDFVFGAHIRGTDFVRSLRQGADPIKAFGRTAEALATDNIQLVNALTARFRQHKPQGREERLYRRLGEGLGMRSVGMEPEHIEPIETVGTRRTDVSSGLHPFRRAEGPAEIRATMPEVKGYVAATGQMPRIQSEIRPESFYKFMEKLEGPTTAKEVRKADWKREADVYYKRAMISGMTGLRYKTQTPTGP